MITIEAISADLTLHDHRAGVRLPDGRLILSGVRPSEIETYSSEDALRRRYPNATVRHMPSADATVNQVS